MFTDRIRVWLATAITAFLWLIILPAFILYIPNHFASLASGNNFLRLGAAEAAAWSVFVLFLLVGIRIVASKWFESREGRRFTIALGLLGFAFALLGEIGHFKEFEALFEISWVSIAAIFGIFITIAQSMTQNNFGISESMRLSAATAIGPMFALLAGGMSLSIAAVQENFYFLAGAAALVAGCSLSLLQKPGSPGLQMRPPLTANGNGWRRYLVLSLILSLGVSLMNSFVAFRLALLPDLTSASIGNNASILVAIGAAVCAVTILLVGFTRLASMSPKLITLFGSIVLVASATLGAMASSMEMLALATIACGVGFGFTNAVEFQIVSNMSFSSSQRTAALAKFTALTCTPYVFSGPLGSWMLGFGFGVIGIYIVALSVFLIASTLVVAMRDLHTI